MRSPAITAAPAMLPMTRPYTPRSNTAIATSATAKVTSDPAMTIMADCLNMNSRCISAWLTLPRLTSMYCVASSAITLPTTGVAVNCRLASAATTQTSPAAPSTNTLPHQQVDKSSLSRVLR